MGEITGFTRTHAVFVMKTISFIDNNCLHCFTSVLLKDEVKRRWSDETRRGSCLLFTDSYNRFQESFLVFQDSMLPKE